MWKSLGEVWDEDSMDWNWPGFSDEGKGLLDVIEEEMKGPREFDKKDHHAVEVSLTRRARKQVYELEKQAIMVELISCVRGRERSAGWCDRFTAQRWPTCSIEGLNGAICFR